MKIVLNIKKKYIKSINIKNGNLRILLVSMLELHFCLNVNFC